MQQKKKAWQMGMRIGSRVQFWDRADGEERACLHQGVISGMYPEIFACKVRNGVTRCFRYNQFCGNEQESDKVKLLKRG